MHKFTVERVAAYSLTSGPGLACNILEEPQKHSGVVVDVAESSGVSRVIRGIWTLSIVAVFRFFSGKESVSMGVIVLLVPNEKTPGVVPVALLSVPGAQ